MRRGLLIVVLSSGLACTDSAPAAKEPAPAKPPPVDAGLGSAPDPERSVPERPDPTPPAAMAPVDGFFMAEGAPQPRACTSAKDCKGDTIPDLDNPCCQDPRTLEPYTWTYQTWLNGWRSTRCVDVVCPPPPNPTQPPACAFEVDCVAGACVDACE